MRTIIIGLSNELPLTAPETLEIADSLVRRVAAIKTPSPWMQSSQSGAHSSVKTKLELKLSLRYQNSPHPSKFFQCYRRISDLTQTRVSSWL